MRRSIFYSYLFTLVACTLYIVYIDEDQTILSSVVHHRVRQQAQAAKPEARVLFVGDMMFDRSVRKVAQEKGYDHLFSCLDETFGNVDAIVGNLEGPITTYPSVSISKKVGEVGNTQFTFDPAVAAALARAGFAAVSIGNNHIRDFGPQGIAQTRTYLDAHDIAYTGDPTDAQNRAVSLMIHGVPLTIIAYNQFGGSAEDTLAALAAHTHETTVVFAHWGEEYAAATAYQKKLAQQFVTAGADVVIGAHPHVVQEHEYIEGVPVFYSLGNFIFDQYWTPLVRKGEGVTILFTADGVAGFERHPFMLETDRRTCPRPVDAVL